MDKYIQLEINYKRKLLKILNNKANNRRQNGSVI